MSSRNGRAKARPAPLPPSHRRARRKETFIQRNRVPILASVAIIGAIALVVALILAGGGGSTGASAATAADPALVSTATSVPADVFDAVGSGSATNPPVAISGDALTANGKPEVLYVGGEFCPFCAAERWALLLALSRFGTFSDLKVTRSSPGDVFPSTPTFSFYGAGYTSGYLSFVPVEQYSNERSGNSYATLQALTPDQQKVVDAYDKNGIPFVDFGGKYVLSGASYSPSLLAGLDWQTIASRLTQKDSEQSKAIVGAANVITASICQMTGGMPANVCTAAGTQSAAALLK